MATRKSVRQQLRVGDLEIPIQIVKEYRGNVRLSITSSQAILRLPWNIDHAGEQEALAWFHQTLASKLERNPAFKSRFASKTYTNGQEIRTTAATYRLRLMYEPRASAVGKLGSSGNIDLRMSDTLNGWDLQRTVGKLLGQLISKDQLPAIQARVKSLNQTHFQYKIGKISLRDQQTRWGSCSSKGNINLSSRLLLAPLPVLDYVIIHELAHLAVFDHSDKFWQLVAKAMPTYREKEQWLNTEGQHIAF